MASRDDAVVSVHVADKALIDVKGAEGWRIVVTDSEGKVIDDWKASFTRMGLLLWRLQGLRLRGRCIVPHTVRLWLVAWACNESNMVEAKGDER